MAVTQRGQNYQAVLMLRGERYRKTFPQKGEAEAWEKKIKFSILNNIEIKETSKTFWTFRKAAEECMTIEWVGEKSEKENESKIRLLSEFFIDYFGTDEIDINKIDTEVLDKFVKYFRSKGNSDSTINRKLMGLSKIMRFAHDRKKVLELPKFPTKKEQKNRIRYISREEEIQLLDFFDFSWGSIYRDYYIVAVDTGMRRGEMLKLIKKDITSSNVIVWDSKSGKSRDIELTIRAKKVLKRITLVLKDTDRVFPISETQLRYYFEKMRNTFPEMADVTPHTMRHTFCTRLVQGGKPINEVKELMGHSEITTTMRYAHFAPKRGTSDVSLLDEFSSGLE
tara:strand:- start:454 stop:1467 length:1014 start_codon:yes stop_codon:yes gene_type:complete